MKNPWTIAVLATILMGLLMACLDIGFPDGGIVWREWVTEHSTLVYFCEPASIHALFRQKVDTYSNLGFFFYAILAFALAYRDKQNPNTGFAIIHPIWSKWFAFSMLMTFIGSTFFHASLTRSGEALDLAGVYATALLPGFFNLHRLGCLWKRRNISPTPFLFGWGIAWLVFSLLIFIVSSRVVVSSALLLIGISGFILWLRIHPRRGWLFAGASIIVTGLAALFFIFDIQKVACDPGSWYQAHGIWHLLSASAAAVYYGFMRRLS